MEMSNNSSTSPLYIRKFLESFGIKKIDNQTKSIDLIRNLKNLILSNKKYDRYSDCYSRLTTTCSFKHPDIIDYPVQKNQSLISLQKSHKSNHKASKNTSYYKKTEYPIINTEHSKADTAYMRRVTDISENNTKQTSGSINESSLLNLIDQFNNMDSVIYKYISYKEKYSLMANDIALSDLLNKTNYTHEIFKQIGIKENSFNVNNENINIILKCYSMKISFFLIQSTIHNTDAKNASTNKIHSKTQEIVFPFELMLMFYGLPFDELKLFLSLIIRYDNENRRFEINSSVFEKYYTLFKETKKCFKENSLYSLLNTKGALIQLEYPWATFRDRYRAKIKLPHYSFEITYINPSAMNQLPIIIEKTIDIQHLSYFIQTEFKDWDLYLMNSLSVYKKFRNVVNQSLSKNPLKHSNRKIMLGFPLTKSIEDLSEKIWNFFFSDKEGDSYYVQFNSLKIILHFPDNELQEEEYKQFDLSMKQSRQLLRLRQSFSIEKLLKRCILIDSKADIMTNNIINNISLCYNTLDLFDDAYCRYLIEQKDHINNEMDTNMDMNNELKKEKQYDILFMYD